ncbi:uncharacterized protein Gasu_06080 [Galdieria sulphuraria]|uniref:Uncharacterized protein n=1 Tax=Galdieria sulphuraria TaxID=130081 RepID=M2X6Q2_GALSU|nr:uncharacterized protein Gasu_06080 [Galdieria sulphuraria]EME32195.1 hypothetical protein Gasu_06080 [Galdieria sulphuraria]|eukprot:XP_005708715.1 hypothetical protein Gasu_06080 [Galdieria sulphuraria]
MMENRIYNKSSLELQQILHPLNHLRTAQDITQGLRRISRTLDRLLKYKSDSSNDMTKLERLSRVRHSLRASKKQLHSLTRQLQENSIVYRVHEISSSKHERLLARFELCSFCSECDFFVTRTEATESESSVDVVTISTTSLLIDISINPEKGIESVSFRFFSQDGEEFTDDKLCETIESWLISERFSLFEEKLRTVWKLDRIDQHMNKLDIVKLLHHLRLLFRNVCGYEHSKSLPIQDGHGWILPDLEGVMDLFYSCCCHRQLILQGYCREEDWMDICKECPSCMSGVISIREELEEKEVFFPMQVPNEMELEQEDKFPVDLQKWVGVGISAELSFLISLQLPIKMTLTTARLLYLCYEEEWTHRHSRYSYGKEWFDISHSHMPCILLEEALLEDCGYPMWCCGENLHSSSETWTRVHRDSGIIENSLEYVDGRRMILSYSLPVRFSLRRRCVQVDCVPFLRIDKLITILGILRQQLVFNQLFQSLFCDCYADGRLYTSSQKPMNKDSSYTRLVTCCFKEGGMESSDFRFEVVVHPPFLIELYLWRMKEEQQLEAIQVNISIGSHGWLQVSMNSIQQHIGWFEKVLKTTSNIPLCLFHLWKKLESNDLRFAPS